MKQVRIQSQEIVIRSSPGDDYTLGRQAEWLNNPELMKYSEQRHHRHTIESQRTYWGMFSGSNLFLAIYVSGEMVGTATVYADDYNSIADLGIMIGSPEHQGIGYGRQAWNAIIEHLFKNGTRKVEAGCMAINTPMMTVCAKSGMFPEGIQPKHFMVDGELVDLVHWGKFK